MKNPLTNRKTVWGARRADPLLPQMRMRPVNAGRLSALGCSALMVMAMASSAWAQFRVSMTANPIRMSVPVNSTGSYASTVTLSLGPSSADGVNSIVTLTASGVPSTGGGAAVVFDSQSFTNNTTNTVSATATFTLNYTNLAEGQYDMAVEANGDASYRLPIPVLAGFEWSNAGGTTNLTDAANWVGGVAPGASDTVILTDTGENSANTVPTVMVTEDTTIGSVLDRHGNTQYHNWNIAAGKTLSITGDGGFVLLRDELTSNQRAYLAASGEGTMLVSNANASFNLIAYAENTQNRFWFDQLNTLVVDVKRIAIDDIRAYPNYLTNGTTTYPRRWSPYLNLAKTNILRATLTDANGWTNAARDYSFVIGRNRGGNGSGTDFAFNLGLLNEFYFDSMLLGGSGNQADSGGNRQIAFNSSLSGTKSLYLRGADGARMANLTIGDAQVEDGGTVSQGTKIVVDLSAGSIDGLVDKLYLARDADTANGANCSGRLILNAGTLDANDAYLGYQTGPGNGTGVGFCQGRVDVNGTALFRINNTLQLGYTTVASGTPFQAESGYGQLTIAGGTVAANTILVGGITKASVDNNITITSGGTLSVTNTAGASDARINVLTMNDSTLELNVDGAKTDPYVYVTTLTTGGGGNILKLASVTGVTTYPKTIAVISYTGSAAPNFSLDLPVGLYGYVVNNSGAQTVDAVITTNPPANLVWNGTPTGDWDATSANWQGAKIFTDGDTVSFDDTATGTTSVSVVGTVTPGPGGVLVSNVSKSYTISDGNIAGTAQMTKVGTNSLTINATSELPLTINEGSVGGSGAIGFTTVASNAVLNFSGTVNGLSTAGAATSSGTVNIGVAVKGGTYLNSGTINGTFSLTGGVTSNTGTIEATGTSSVGAGATLVQNNQFNNNSSRLSIVGTLTGSGVVSDLTGDTAGNNGRLEINAGGTFTPGGAGVIGNFTVEGRFDLNAGSPDGKLVVDVDLNNPLKNDILYVDKWSNFRGALVMNNIGTTPFAAGQSFLIYSNNFGFPNTPEVAFDLTNKITPVVPGIGLQWDYSNLKSNGILAVVSAPVTPPTITSTATGGTNLTVSWPKDHVGYQLQVQTNDLATGISTNWFPIEGSENSNTVSVAIDPNSPAVFFRLSNH